MLHPSATLFFIFFFFFSSSLSQNCCLFLTQPHKHWPVSRWCSRCDCSDSPPQLFYASVTSFVSESFRGTLTYSILVSFQLYITTSTFLALALVQFWNDQHKASSHTHTHIHSFFCSIFYSYSDFQCKSISWKPACLPSTGSEALLHYQQCHLNSAVLLNYWTASFQLHVVSLCLSGSVRWASIRPRYPLRHQQFVQCLQT